MELITQLDQMDCGPTCLQMICLHFGQRLSIKQARELCDKGQSGVTFLGLAKAAERIGLKAHPIKAKIEPFLKKAILPCIVHWNREHYVVVYKTSRKKIYVADPEGKK